jgi:hypothetical protein
MGKVLGFYMQTAEKQVPTESEEFRDYDQTGEFT